MARIAPAPRTRKLAGDGAQVAGPSRRKRATRGAGGNGVQRPEPTLRILETRVLRGANYWAREPVIRMLVDLGVLEQFPSNKLPGFSEALVDILPTLEDHACSLGRRGGFLSRLREGTWAGHIAEHIALELQNLAGTDVRHGKTRGAGPPGHYNVIYEYREEQVGLEAGRIAVALVNHLVDPSASPSFMLGTELERLIRLAERLAFGPSTQAIIDEAVSRDIPYLRLDRHSLVQLGQATHLGDACWPRSPEFSPGSPDCRLGRPVDRHRRRCVRRGRTGIAGGQASERTGWAKRTQARWARTDVVWAIEAEVHGQRMASGPSRPYAAAITRLAGASKNGRTHRSLASPFKKAR